MRSRWLCAIGIGLVAAALSLSEPVADFDQLWIAARALLAGQDPYVALHGSFWRDLYYPLPAVLIAIPSAMLRSVVAHACFTGLGFGAAAFALSSRGWCVLIGLASYPALDAAQLAQWSPFFVAAALLPHLEWLAIAKPTTGLATVAAYSIKVPRRRLWFSIAVSVLLVGASFIAHPDWLVRWITTTTSAAHFAPLVARPGGVLLLAAILKWRLPEARLLVLLAVVPQTIAPYEALLLTLVLRTRREALLFSFASFAMMPFLTRVGAGAALAPRIDHDAPLLILFLYLPALVMVLRRPNAGSVPQPIERAAALLPAWLRGTDPAS